MRVLHLIDHHSPQAQPTTLAMLHDSLGRLGAIEQHLVLLGGSKLGRLAREVGIVRPRCVGVPFGRAWLSPTTLRRALQAQPSFDLIHCWSIGALAAATLQFTRLPRVLTLTRVPSPAATRLLRILVNDRGPVVLLVATAAIRYALITSGIDPQSVPVLRPGLDMGRVPHAQRAQLRESWGIDAAAGSHGQSATRVIALLADEPAALDARPSALIIGLAQESLPADGPDLVLLTHPDVAYRLQAQHAMAALARRHRLVHEPALDQPWRALPGCDLALALGDEGSILSLHWAMAANVPIVGEATSSISEIVEDHHSALLCKPGEPRAVAHRIAQTLQDPNLAWKLRDTARHEAYSFFSRRRYCECLRLAYEQVLAGQPVELPPLEVTGGLRFAGRA